MASVIVHYIMVGIPRVHVLINDGAAPELHCAHAALDESSRHEALPAERFAGFIVEPVQALGLFALTIDVDGLRSAPLHPKSQFIRADAGRQLADPGMLLDVILVQASQFVQLCALWSELQAAGRRMQVKNGIAGRAEQRTLIGSR